MLHLSAAGISQLLELLLTEFNGRISRSLVCRFLLRLDYTGESLRQLLWNQRQDVRCQHGAGHSSTESKSEYCLDDIDLDIKGGTGVFMVEPEALSAVYFHIALSVTQFRAAKQ